MQRAMQYCVVLSVGLLGGSCAMAAQTSANQMGEWVMRAGQRTLFVLSIHPAGKPGQACTGSLSRPQHLRTADGVSFNHVQGPTETEPIVACERDGDSLSITVVSPKDASDRDTYQLKVRDDANADLEIKGGLIPLLKLQRAQGAAAVFTDWNQSKSYSPDDEMPSNAEMKRIVDEDQRGRQPGLKTGWAEATHTDAERREQTRRLLADGALHTGEDFWRAALVFQHGSKPEDYLLADTLAIVALKKGNQDGAWLAAATLDRYL